jgi:hypothetical protein
MIFTCSHPGCSVTFSDDKELKAHRKSLHSQTITFKFFSCTNPVTVVRHNDGYFECPACNFQKAEYMLMYNHCTRTKTLDHQVQVKSYLAAASQGSQSDDSHSNHDLVNSLCLASQKVWYISVVSSKTTTLRELQGYTRGFRGFFTAKYVVLI